MEDKTQLGSVETHIKEGIATITFQHPAHNSLPAPLLANLAAAIRRAGDDEAVRVVVLRSGGERTFCAGASFDELVAIRDEASGKSFFLGFANVINAMRRCPKFIIARIQGKAVGGGVGLAAAADYTIASHYASVKLSELAIGFGPFVIGPAVERKMGKAAFTHLAINAAEWQTAEWAKAHGLFQEVFPTTEQVDSYVDHLAGRLAAYHPDAMRELKQVFWDGTEHWENLLDQRAALSGRLALSAFTRQAIEQFKEKA